MKRIQKIHTVNNAEEKHCSDRLKEIWITETFRAFLFTPMLEISAVTQVPIFWPIMMGIAVPYVTLPVRESACKIPTEAEEL